MDENGMVALEKLKMFTEPDDIKMFIRHTLLSFS
jgi:hypothetical protein